MEKVQHERLRECTSVASEISACVGEGALVA